MIPIKSDSECAKIKTAGLLLAGVFDEVHPQVRAGVSTLALDTAVERMLSVRGLVAASKGYKGYRHATCISINDEVVHGVPSSRRTLKDGDLVKIDVCASYEGFFADMARSFIIGGDTRGAQRLVEATSRALDDGIACATVGARLSNISAAVQRRVQGYGFDVVRDFAGHGVGKAMHEEPEILNYGVPGHGPMLAAGMVFAIEPMVTKGNYRVFVASDGWTVKTVDGSLAAHVEDTVIVINDGPVVVTRPAPGSGMG